MRFEVETGQRRRPIEVRRSGSGWAVKMDGRAMWVDLARVDDRWSMLVRSVEAETDPQPHEIDPTGLHGDSYEIAIEPRNGADTSCTSMVMSCR